MADEVLPMSLEWFLARSPLYSAAAPISRHFVLLALALQDIDKNPPQLKMRLVQKRDGWHVIENVHGAWLDTDHVPFATSEDAIDALCKHAEQTRAWLTAIVPVGGRK